MILNKQYINLMIVIAAAIFFIPFLGEVHLFDWDEINFAECAREMITTSDYLTMQINFEPFTEKPPLFMWLSAISMKAFGINEFAARLPNALCGIVTMVILFNIGSRLYDKKMGLIWIMCYVGSTLPQFYFKSGIIDPWFNLFIFSGVWFFFLFTFKKENGENKAKLAPLLLSAICIGLAVLTKGPVAFLIAAICFGVYLIIKRFKKVITVPQVILYIAVICSIGGLWFLTLVMSGKGKIIGNFLHYQFRLLTTEDSGHGGPFIFHFIILLIGCFPASVFAIRSFKFGNNVNPFQKHFTLWMMILFWVVLLLFSIVKTKIIHYSSLCYFPLSFLAALSVYQLMNGTIAWKKWMNYLLLITGGILAIALALLPQVEKFKEKIIHSGIIKDDFAVANLSTQVQWQGWESLIGILSLAGIICALVMIRRQKIKTAMLILFIGNMFVTHMASIILVPKIEQYTQGASIAFYKSLQNKKCYVEALNYKSYSQYFYTNKKPGDDPRSSNLDWLLRGDVDRDVYFVGKITDVKNNQKEYPFLREIARENGFVFYIRELAKK
jgi:4-amino-4-deoxy-L-arabinose transferase-like glycosyltransferase